MRAILVFHEYLVRVGGPISSWPEEFNGNFNQLKTLIEQRGKVKEGFTASYAILHQIVELKEEHYDDQ